MGKHGDGYLDWFRKTFPREYEKRKAEGRCLHCGELPTPRPFKLRERDRPELPCVDCLTSVGEICERHAAASVGEAPSP